MIDQQEVSSSHFQSFLHGLFQPFLGGTRDTDFVNQKVDAVLLGLLEEDIRLELSELTIHADAQKTLPPQPVEQAQVFSSSSFDKRGQDHHLLSRLGLRDSFQDLLRSLRADPPTAARTVGDSHTGKKEPQKIKHLCHRSDSRTRVRRDCPLIDRNGRREAFDGLHFRLFHLFDILAGIG